jgi:sec-independent protein translocase protein TatB
MFDITSSKLLLLAIVALLVIGPKDFPVLLRTIGKYMGIIRGHAREFRAQFDEAMRDAELSQLKKDVENIAQETEASFRSTEQALQQSVDEVRQSVDTSIETVKQIEPVAHDANGMPIVPLELAPPTTPTATANGDGGSRPEGVQSAPSEAAGDTQPHTPPPGTEQVAAEPGRPVEKSGA